MVASQSPSLCDCGASCGVQTTLEAQIDAKVVKPESVVVDVGAGIGEADFAAAVFWNTVGVYSSVLFLLFCFFQTTLEALIDAKVVKPESVVVDVGAGIGEAVFAASAMGVRVTALEPVFANALRLCDGVYLNRADDLVKVHLAAASDVPGNITVHNVSGHSQPGDRELDQCFQYAHCTVQYKT